MYLNGDFDRVISNINRLAAMKQAIIRQRASGALPASEAIPSVPISEIKAYAQGITAERPSGNQRIKKTFAASINEARTQLAIGPMPDMPRLYCYEPFRTAYIKRGGHVMPCCLWPEYQHSFGDINKNSALEIWNGAAFNLTRAAIIAGEYPRGCHFCVRSRAAPEDPQLWQATSFINWYREGCGVDLTDDFGSPVLISADRLTSGLARANILAGVSSPPSQRNDTVGIGSTKSRVVFWTARQRSSAGSTTSASDGVFGWAWSPQFPEVNLPLEITANGANIGQTAAIVFREDLRSLGYGTGHYGFRLGVPVDLSRPVDLGFQVPGTPFSSQAFTFGEPI
jgi:hypothetical protein